MTDVDRWVVWHELHVTAYSGEDEEIAWFVACSIRKEEKLALELKGWCCSPIFAKDDPQPALPPAPGDAP